MVVVSVSVVVAAAAAIDQKWKKWTHRISRALKELLRHSSALVLKPPSSAPHFLAFVVAVVRRFSLPPLPFSFLPSTLARLMESLKRPVLNITTTLPQVDTTRTPSASKPCCSDAHAHEGQQSRPSEVRRTTINQYYDFGGMLSDEMNAMHVLDNDRPSCSSMDLLPIELLIIIFSF